MLAVFGEAREVVLARELTKNFETVINGSLARLLEVVTNDTDQQKGEMVLVVAGAEDVKEDEAQLRHIMIVLLEELP